MRPPAGGAKPRPYGSTTLAELLRQRTRLRRMTSAQARGAALVRIVTGIIFIAVG